MIGSDDDDERRPGPPGPLSPRVYVVALLLWALLLIPFWARAARPAGFDFFCANEGDPCVTVDANVALFGVDSYWSGAATIGAGSGYTCSASNYGDPGGTPGTRACWTSAPNAATSASAPGGGSSSPAGDDPPFNWSKTSHLLQAMLVGPLVFLFAMGYRAGRTG